ncbi:MAG: TIGR03936 family radical SAM-associated protein [Planctomycetota bacterium]|jgi:radical SAM-linked protein
MNETLPLVIKFRVGGALRFLSHAETLRVFQRACVRAQISIKYSEGFNPRPRLSLPLPRPVGVESDDELMSLRCSMLDSRCSTRNTIKEQLSAQLPEGIDLISVDIARPGASYQPLSATYVLSVRPEYLNDELKATIERIMSCESLDIQRKTGARGSRIKNINVRPFLTSIETDEHGIIIECGISPAGSVRVDEVLSLLELDQNMLAAPIRRTCVRWRQA